MDAETPLYRMQGSLITPATQDDLPKCKPIFNMGEGKNKNVGVLLLHGFSTTTGNFFEYARELIAQGYTVSAPLLPGHGDKPEGLLNVARSQWIDSALESYDALRKECSKVFVIGFSMGAALALNLASKRNDIQKLFLLSPAIKPSNKFKLGMTFLLPIFRLLNIRYFPAIGGDIHDKTTYEIGYKKVAINGLVELWKIMHETQDRLPHVKADTIIFQSRNDHAVDFSGAQMIHDRIGSTHKELVWVDDSYHVIPMDYSGRFVLERILRELYDESNQ